MPKRPTAEEIAAAVVASGATAEQGAASAVSITAMLATSPDTNAYLTEFNNKIRVRWNDIHGDTTIYDEFRTKDSAPTVAAVVYERLAPVDFSFGTDIAALPADEGTDTRKIPEVHAVLKSVNVEQRFKTTTSKIELDKIEDGERIGVDNVVSNLGASYADDRTEKFIAVVNGIESARSGDVVNAMATLADVSKFIQDCKYYAFKFKEKRTSLYNAYGTGAAGNKADTKLAGDTEPVVFIDPKKLYQIEGDYYATLFQIQQALPDVKFVEVDGLTGNKFAIMCDRRVVLWSQFYFEISSEQIRGREAGELNHYLFAKDIMGSFNCFNRMIFKTE